jgi:hypothetical protein
VRRILRRNLATRGWKKPSARHTPEELQVHFPRYRMSTGSSGVSAIDARGTAGTRAGASPVVGPVKGAEPLTVYPHCLAALGLEHDWSVWRPAAADLSAALLEVI